MYAHTYTYAGDKDVYNELFATWDVDNSGALDYKELDKAIRKAQGQLANIGAQVRDLLSTH